VADHSATAAALPGCKKSPLPQRQVLSVIIINADKHQAYVGDLEANRVTIFGMN
jgi:hypothetical protein